VRAQEVVERERVQRRREDAEEKQHREREARVAPAFRRDAADDEHVRDRERGNERERVRIQRPSVGLGIGATLSAARA
jgi:hypothetical protein